MVTDDRADSGCSSAACAHLTARHPKTTCGSWSSASGTAWTAERRSRSELIARHREPGTVEGVPLRLSPRPTGTPKWVATSVALPEGWTTRAPPRWGPRACVECLYPELMGDPSDELL